MFVSISIWSKFKIKESRGLDLNYSYLVVIFNIIAILKYFIEIKILVLYFILKFAVVPKTCARVLNAHTHIDMLMAAHRERMVLSII